MHTYLTSQWSKLAVASNGTRHTHNSTTEAGFYKSAIQSANGHEAIVKSLCTLPELLHSVQTHCYTEANCCSTRSVYIAAAHGITPLAPS